MHRPFSSVLREKTVPKLLTPQCVRLFSASSCSYDSEVTVCVPPMAESISEGTLNQFNKEVGDYVEKDEEIATIETDKIDVAVNAPEAGIVQELLVSEGDTVNVGQSIAKISVGSGQSSSAEEWKPQEESLQEGKTKSVSPAREAVLLVENSLVEAPVKPTELSESAAPVAEMPSIPAKQDLKQFPGYRGSRGENSVSLEQTSARFVKVFNSWQ